jgi:uncharacterized protein YggE
MKNLVRVYAEDGSFIDREMNEAELKQFEIDKAEDELKQQAMNKAVANKAAAQAKLEALGLTTDDLKALGL